MVSCRSGAAPVPTPQPAGKEVSAAHSLRAASPYTLHGAPADSSGGAFRKRVRFRLPAGSPLPIASGSAQGTGANGVCSGQSHQFGLVTQHYIPVFAPVYAKSEENKRRGDGACSGTSKTNQGRFRSKQNASKRGISKGAPRWR